MELHRGAPVHAQPAALRRLRGKPRLSRDGGRNQLQYQSADHCRVRDVEHQPAAAIFPEVWVGAVPQILCPRFSGGLMFQGNFTWASAFDYANDYFLWNHDIDYGRENGVRRFVFNLHEVYALPFGRQRKFLNNASRGLDLLVGGWQLSGIWLWQSGIPFTPGYADCSRDMDTGPCRAIQVGDTSVANPGPSGWYATATPGTSGPGVAVAYRSEAHTPDLQH